MSTHADFGRRSKDRYGAGVTPFRYPGGKAFLADALEEHIKQRPVAIDTYAEAYAGGAGAAIELLARGTVERIVLNDFDRRVFAAWWAILNQTEEFIARIKSTPVTLDSWWACRALVDENAADADRFELGFATYFLNRTNRSGVIIGAGPIGGYNQVGKWLIDARWYAETMIKRVRWLGDRRDDIELHSADGLHFLKAFEAKRAQSTFFLIDPPYVVAGKKLYFDAMSDLKHRDLAHFLTAPGAVPHWLVTYDDCQLITDAYHSALIERLPVKYSLHRKRTEFEVCVVPAQAA